MGCCFSTSAGSNSPYPGGAPSSSARVITSPPQPVSQAEEAHQTSPASQSHRHQSRRHQQPLDQHINKPLRRHEWAARNKRWTRVALDRERDEFFDTRVTGRPEVWQTLHATLQVLWDPVASGAEGDGTYGLATAQGILTAAEITLPSGDLAQGAYDSLGNYYALPEWIVSDPSNITRHDDDDSDKGTSSDHKGDRDSDDDEVDEETARRREEKGKAVVDIHNLITVYARLSENSQDVRVSVGRGESVASLARKVLEESGLSGSKTIRIAYMGKILKENSPLLAQGWKHGHIVNALVFAR